VVDNDHPVRQVSARILRELGYTVVEAPSGVEALKLFRSLSARIDLVVSELVMPLMSGHELAGRLQAIEPALKVLYISGEAESTIADLLSVEERELAIRKPFNPAVLARRIRDMLDS
jgi:CheY-like chemotaxis protein